MRFRKWIQDVCVMSLILYSSMAMASLHFYVDPENGNDAWDGLSLTYRGTTIGPKKTLTAARDAVRQRIQSGLTSDVYVELRGGRYELSSTLSFNQQDGHSIYQITWRNYNHEPVRISGGKKIVSSWSWDSAKGCYKTFIPEVASGEWWFRDLYRDDQRLIRSRWPNAPTDVMKMVWSPDRLPSDPNLITLTSVNAEKTQLGLNMQPPQTLAASHKAEIVLFRLWTSLRTVISDSQGSVINLVEPMTGCLVIQPGEEYTRKGFLENSYTFIDQENEWALDTEGYLYYRGTDPESCRFMAPNIHTLISVEGSNESSRVQNLNFQGLTLEHANFVFPNGGLNWYPRQAGVPCDFIHIPAAVRFSYTQNCSLQTCNIVRCNGVGIHLDTGSWADSIEYCTVSDIGNTGIILGNANEEYVTPTRTAYARVENTRVNRCGLGDFSSIGIGEMFMHGSVIRHNEVYDLPNSGISLGWHWWSSTTNVNAQNIDLSYNHVHHVCQMMDDGGAIYTLDDLTGSKICHNLIQQVGFKGLSCTGIYTDEGSKNYLVSGNVVDTVYDGWCHFLHYENFNGTIQNNLYIDGYRREIYAALRNDYEGFFANISRNILYQKTNSDSYLSYNNNWDIPEYYDVDYNCYYHPGNPTKTFAGYLWSYWQVLMGNDQHSYYQQDPMFQDATHADKNYLLKSDSPLLSSPMNFQQLKVQNAGILPAGSGRVTVADQEIEVEGTVDNTFRATHTDNAVYQTLTEVSSSGPPSKRFSYLEHKWIFHLDQAGTHTVRVNAHKSQNNEGDEFVLAYSTDDISYTDMLTITKMSHDNIYQEYTLPSTLKGTVFIRVNDADQTGGNVVLDCLMVDHLYIDSHPTETLPGDLTLDKRVDLLDFSKLSESWLKHYDMTGILQIASDWISVIPNYDS